MTDKKAIPTEDIATKVDYVDDINITHYVLAEAGPSLEEKLDSIEWKIDLILMTLAGHSPKEFNPSVKQ